ncbi:hypothetical protein [Bacillus sp. V2I10]|uniref:hypothetical protein n=1 Tax=Bacillus sp. V2I10 TaxID=3042276 RepID=UPI00278AA571|nr:hypothetical protein [Bacillus sp. V2I10]MDQ0862046.1 quinol-cytochrome oxidoreductase complex cytochrome b subunit [Bacillus sp. V2I10]
MKDLVFYLMAFLGVLIMIISVINMFIIDMKNKKNNQKKSKSKHVKLAVFGFIVYVLSRIVHGQFL